MPLELLVTVEITLQKRLGAPKTKPATIRTTGNMTPTIIRMRNLS